MKSEFLLFLPFLFVTACGNGDNGSDAYGNFEATEVTISSESNGKLISFDIEEGNELKPAESVGQVDTLQLYYKKQQLEAAISAIYANGNLY